MSKATSIRRVCALLVLACGPVAAGETAAHAGHHHGSIAADPAHAPGVQIKAGKDTMAGWNVHIVTTHFQFAPEHVNQAHQAGEGHAHIYVDGHKVARVYGPWFHLENQEPGRHEVRVTLNANTHDELTLNGKTIDAVAVIQQ